jgi:diguanylate cyclase (GGDEF)-like protein
MEGRERSVSSRVDARRAVAPARPAQAELGGAILIVEDDPFISDALEQVLEELGYDVTIAATGQRALESMQASRPDLVLLDLTLPDVDGLDLTRQLRSDPRWNAVPIIALTARDHLNDRVVGLREGLDDYLTKPFNIAELAARLDANLRRSRRELHTSPLTLLPGNRDIEATLSSRLASGQDFAVAYCDLDNFKPYNDRYGFAQGDVIIRALADAIQRAVVEIDDALPGHIGGDDFVVVIGPDDAEQFCRRVIQDFEELLPKAYPPEDYARGQVEAQDRNGTLRTFPLVSLSIACVVQSRGSYKHVGELSRAAAEVKSYLKKQSGSNFMIDRRGGG